jgi:D-beta-D-heptose 7-phosphate kinase/D-beta-D-heptose 1-phosphate adenosyltransferase
MEALLDRCLRGRRPNILLVGDVICDVYLWGKVSRISPEAPVPVFERNEQSHVLGGAANVAANLRTLGCNVHLVGVVGADEAGRRVRELLRQQGIDDSLVVEDTSRPTTEKTRVIAQQQNVLRLDQERRHPLAPALISRTLERAEMLMTKIDAVVCSDYDKGVCTPDFLKPLFAMARSSGCPIMADPKVRDFSRYRGATVLTPNLFEVEQASGITVQDDTALNTAAGVLLGRSQAEALLVTRGKDGMSLFHPPEPPVHIRSEAREVFDVTGAGDTVIAAFCLGVVSGLSFSEAAFIANTAAGIAVGKVGTAVVYPEDLRAALREERQSWGRKILRLEELAVALQHRRQRGERIVFTNGCFDLLHVGHIQYLQQARALGDCLIVGLNDDSSVRLLKGERRPLITHDERARILAALQSVDYVTIFRDETPLNLIKRLRPDILAKGGDYVHHSVVGGNEVEAYGGRVEILPYVNGVSTTEFINGVLKRYA